MKCGKFFTGVIGDVEHRQQKIAAVDVGTLRRRAGSLNLSVVDRGIKIDEVPAALPRGMDLHHDVSLGVEAARVAEIRVVDDDRIDVAGLTPTAALDVNRNER